MYQWTFLFLGLKARNLRTGSVTKNSCALLVGLTDLSYVTSLSLNWTVKPGGVNTDTTTEWLNAVWRIVCEGYAGSDIFNADGTRIFILD
jgi:hypothetical protein